VLYFYLSHAHTDDADDRHVQSFYHDLSAEVRVRAGSASSEEVGFRAGDYVSRRPPEVVRALSSCRTFVALCGRSARPARRPTCAINRSSRRSSTAAS